MQMYMRAILLFHSSAGQTKNWVRIMTFAVSEHTFNTLILTKQNKSFHCDFTVNFLISAKF